MVHRRSHWISIILILAGVLLTRLPAVFGIPLAAYVSVGLLLVGGITGLPWLIALLLDWLSPKVAQHALALLALERARRARETAAVLSYIASLKAASAPQTSLLDLAA